MKESQPIVSVGIFVFNEVKFIEEAIVSVINQTYQNLEIIVSDNCSTDGTIEIIERYAQRDPRIKFYRQEQNIGAHENFKFVLHKSTGEYFMWMGGHDIILPSLVERAVSVFKINNKSVLVYSDSEFINHEGLTISKSANSNIDNYNLSRTDRLKNLINNIGYCTPVYGLFKKSVLKNIPIYHMVGNDNLILFYAAYLGEISQLSSVLYQRREVRQPQDSKDVLERYKIQGIYDGNSSPYDYFIIKHLVALFKFKHISLVSKYKISLLIYQKYIKRYNLNKKTILKELAFNIFNIKRLYKIIS